MTRVLLKKEGEIKELEGLNQYDFVQISTTYQTLFGIQRNSRKLFTSESTEPNSCQEVPMFVGKRVKAVEAGTQHALVLFENGDVYTSGDNNYGQRGTSTSSPFEFVMGDIQQIATGVYSSYALSDAGQLYAWGSNSDGQLGLGDTNKQQKTPAAVKASEPIREVIARNNTCHSFYITESGILYASGWNTYGQLGLGHTNRVCEYVPVPKFYDHSPIHKMTTTCNSNLVILKNGEVYTWGLNDCGQLGLAHSTNLSTPARVTLPSNGIAIDATSGYHFYVVTYLSHGNGLSHCFFGSMEHSRNPQATPVRFDIPKIESSYNMRIGKIIGQTCHIYLLQKRDNLWPFNPRSIKNYTDVSFVFAKTH